MGTRVCRCSVEGAGIGQHNAIVAILPLVSTGLICIGFCVGVRPATRFAALRQDRRRLLDIERREAISCWIRTWRLSFGLVQRNFKMSSVTHHRKFKVR